MLLAPRQPRHGRCGLVLAALVAFASPVQAFADRLVWLAPARASTGTVTVGLTQLDEQGLAQLPSAAKISSVASFTEQSPAGPVRVFSASARGRELLLTAAAPGLPEQSVTVAIGPPGARVDVTATPERPVKGRDVEVRLAIAVLTGAGTPDADAPAPVLRANVGEVQDVQPLGGGRFSARYVLPRERYPEVAIVVAFSPWPHADAAEGSFGRAVIPLASAVTLPGKTEPNVEIAVEIAGETFGPVHADPKGLFEVPVVVPPGHRFGTSIATDRLGNRRRKSLDLQLPPTDQIACVSNPAALPADGASMARILCVATDPYGVPVEKAKLKAKARQGKLEGPLVREGGVYEWDYTAPKELPAAAEQLTFEFPAGGADSKETVALRLTPQVLQEASLSFARLPVFEGGASAVTIVGTDAQNRRVELRPELKARRGQLSAFTAGPELVYSARYDAPKTIGEDWSDEVSGAVHAAHGQGPARLAATIVDGAVRARVEDLAGEPVQGVALSCGEGKATTDEDGLATLPVPPSKEQPARTVISVVARPGIRAELFHLRTADGERIFPALPLAQVITLARKVGLSPPAPVDVRVDELTPERLRYRIIDAAEGKVLRGRPAAVVVTRTSDGAEIALGAQEVEGDGSVSVKLSGAGQGPLSASVTDLASQVSAARSVAP